MPSLWAKKQGFGVGRQIVANNPLTDPRIQKPPFACERKCMFSMRILATINMSERMVNHDTQVDQGQTRAFIRAIGGCVSATNSVGLSEDGVRSDGNSTSCGLSQLATCLTEYV